MNLRFRKKKHGFTLIETLIALSIFIFISSAIYFSYSNVLETFAKAKLRLTAASILENEIEMIHNVPYPDVGVQGGAPNGNLLAEKTVYSGDTPFIVKTQVKNIDNPFDGTIASIPKDIIPADYKLVEVEISCNCVGLNPLKLTTTIAPKNLEKATKNGSLFINVFNASGEPISGANVSIINNSVIPAININDVTNASGSLNFVDIATSSAGFHITVAKNGYSSDQTYPLNQILNPNPTKPDATVKEQELTKISFAIDLVSSINFKTQDQTCKAVPGIDFKIIGSKLIGTNPDVYKYSTDSQTDANGQKIFSNMEWDAYSFNNLSSNFEISGTIPNMPLDLIPASDLTMIWMMEPKNANSFLMTIFDEDDVLINDASVRVVGQGIDQTKMTARRNLGQSDWSNNQYTSKTSDIETDNPLGQLTLTNVGGKYATSSQELISTTFDMGTVNTTFYSLSWNPISQPSQAGIDSLKFQIAANNDNTTWNFVGPNGNGNTYYTAINTQLHSGHNSKRYLRYKVFMQTANDQFTPKLEDITIGFNSSCVPNGQVFFSGLPGGLYDVTVTKSGFNTTDDSISIESSWQEYEEMLYLP